MPAKRLQVFAILAMVMLISFNLSSCYHPPYNNFKPYTRTYKDLATGAGAGLVFGAAISSPVAGATVGAATLASIGLYKDRRLNIIAKLAKRDIQYEQYGDRHTLIIPADRYYLFNLPRLNPICYPSFALILELLRYYPDSKIYIAAFTDDVGSRYHKNTLTQARAETMMTFLWANGIPLNRLKAQGFGDDFSVGDNKLIHGSAYNRRVEIQWLNTNNPQASYIMPYLGPIK